MKTNSLKILERIAGNLPAKNMQYFQAPTQRGNVYVALGRGQGDTFPGESWHGVYGITYGGEMGLARTGEVNGDLSLEDARSQFIDDAAELLSLFSARDMLDPSFRLKNA